MLFFITTERTLRSTATLPPVSPQMLLPLGAGLSRLSIQHYNIGCTLLSVAQVVASVQKMQPALRRQIWSGQWESYPHHQLGGLR